MTGVTHRRQAARAYLARLVAVAAVLAGLALAHGLQCTDGMTAAMHAAPGASMAVGTAQDCGSPAAAMAAVDGYVPERVAPADTSDRLTALCTVPGGAVALAGDNTPGSRGLGGVLATCLAFIVAVVAAVVALRPTGPRRIVRMLRSVRLAVNRAALLRAPSLAELCLLRT
ncbi:MAG: hypothetical protein ACRDSL_19805 [Pseudonocardiaceae bacterium]